LRYFKTTNCNEPKAIFKIYNTLTFNRIYHEVKLAVPSPDHYLPLIYILGLQEKNEQLNLFNDKLVAGSLSMTSIKIF